MWWGGFCRFWARKWLKLVLAVVCSGLVFFVRIAFSIFLVYSMIVTPVLASRTLVLAWFGLVFFVRLGFLVFRGCSITVILPLLGVYDVIRLL